MAVDDLLSAAQQCGLLDKASAQEAREGRLYRLARELWKPVLKR